MILCDIHNPTGSRRTFYDGLTNNRPISIDSGETKTGVKLAEHVVALLKRAVRPDLKITEREAAVKLVSAETISIPLAQRADRDEVITTAPRPRGRPKHNSEG